MINILRKNILWSLMAAALLFTACNDDDDNDPDPNPNPGPTENIAEIAIGNPEYSILVEALQAADLVDVVSDEDATYTVFAPNNDAFNAFFDAQNITDADGDGSRVDDLVDALGAEVVTQTLLYHVLAAEVRAADVPENAYVTTASTFSPNENQLSLLVQNDGGSVMLNNYSSVNNADILATNGVIHGINTVLTIPTVADLASYDENLSSLFDAVGNAGLAETLSDNDATFTVFAPLNSAFEAISGTVESLTTEQLVTVLTYHVLDSEVRAEDVTTGVVPTVSGQSISITVNDEAVTIADADESNTDANVVLTNVQGRNGVVHVIDGVLIPAL
ncbi:MAG: fasciclin domain-containing protein [Cryomorphaceae bacterium]|nr:fasciclin domain-containing protein [Flavobacteriales bacterium]